MPFTSDTFAMYGRVVEGVPCTVTGELVAVFWSIAKTTPLVAADDPFAYAKAPVTVRPVLLPLLEKELTWIWSILNVLDMLPRSKPLVKTTKTTQAPQRFAIAPQYPEGRVKLKTPPVTVVAGFDIPVRDWRVPEGVTNVTL